MCTRLRVWWYEKRVRSAVGALIHHTQEFYEWKDRFVPESNADEATRVYWSRYHIEQANRIGMELKYTLRVPMNQWVRYDDDREMYLDYDRNKQINYKVAIDRKVDNDG